MVIIKKKHPYKVFSCSECHKKNKCKIKDKEKEFCKRLDWHDPSLAGDYNN